MNEKDREAVQAMVSDYGWEVLKNVLQQRRQSAIHALLTAGTFDRVLAEQARVKEIDALLRLPHELIQSTTEEST